MPGHDGHPPPGPSREERARAGQVHLRRHVRERVRPQRLDKGGGDGPVKLHLPSAVDATFGGDVSHGGGLVCGKFREVRGERGRGARGGRRGTYSWDGPLVTYVSSSRLTCGREGGGGIA